MSEINTVLFSDVHLGSPVSRAFDLLNALKELKFKKLIIGGDMFEDLNFTKLTTTHWELLSHLGRISRRGVEVIWVEGNHDSKFYYFMSHLIGIPVHKEYRWQVNGIKFLMTHGHQFDSFMTKNQVLGRILAGIYTGLQRIVSSRFIDFITNRFADKWLRLTEQVAEKALLYAKKKKQDVVICGHTHFVYNIKKAGVEYFNLGCWNAKPSYLLIVQDDGQAFFKVFA
ncbi:MAG: metallophosphoesterase family protein [Elusimicrobia bacterium]|nr:metallophosphoesterase family protein [Elusimicrobiota bacterium]